jgi:hypothetical protein
MYCATMTTPEQMAASNNGPEKNRWLANPARTPRDILHFIQASPIEGHSTPFARAALQVRMSEIAETSSLRLEKQTQTLTRLTYALVIVTLGLLLLTALLVKHP